MKSYKDLEKVLRQYKEDLRKRYKVNKIGIFGSYVRGEQNKKSDVDIIVEYEELPDLLELIELERHLEELLQAKVDLIEKSGIRPELKESILRDVEYV